MNLINIERITYKIDNIDIQIIKENYRIILN